MGDIDEILTIVTEWGVAVKGVNEKKIFPNEDDMIVEEL
jgi:hypothetical protein